MLGLPANPVLNPAELVVTELKARLQQRSVTIKDRSRNNGTARDGNRKSRRVERMRRHVAPSSVEDEAVGAGSEADS